MSEIYKRMTDIMSDIGAIGKNAENRQQGFKFRGIDDVYNTIHDILAKHKVFCTPEVLETHHEERKTKSGGALIYRIYKIKYTFYTDDGTNVSCTVMGEGMDSGDKAGNKAMSIAHKYALLQVFAIPTQGIDDPDSETHEVAPKQKDPERDKLIGEIADEISKHEFSDQELAMYREEVKKTPTEKLGELLDEIRNVGKTVVGKEPKEELF